MITAGVRLLIFFLLCSLVSVGQEVRANQELPPRQKIGLALEGGSALGLAHIGVIRYLEEHRIPVDHVAGTSMGGLIGGLYAIGNDAAELEQLVGTLDWNKVLTDRLSYRSLSYRRKQDQRDFPNPLTLAYDDGLTLPSGFNAGYQVGLLLDRQVLPYSHVTSFDELPIPFRCVAMDLVSRAEFVFGRGSLAQALRATMSLPGVFSPVRDGQHVFVDGGLLNNLPVSVTRRMGADLVIAVHLQTQPVSPEKHMSSLGVLVESSAAVVAANELRSMQQADVLVTVDAAKFTSTDFNRVKELVELGYQAAASKAAILQRLSLSDAEWQKYLAARNARRQTRIPVPQFVAAAGTSADVAHAVEQEFSGYAGKPLDVGALTADLDRSYGTGRFGALGFRLARREGASGLLLHAQPRQPSPRLINPLFAVDAFGLATPQFALGARITHLIEDKAGSEWRSDVFVGSQYSFSTEYYRPLAAGSPVFIAPRFWAGGVPFSAYLGGAPAAEYRLYRVSGGVDLGFRLSRSGELRLGYESGFTHFARRVGTPQLPETTDRLGVTSLRFRLDHLDSPVVPHSGFHVAWDAAYYDAYFGSGEFPSTELDILGFVPVSQRARFLLGASGGTNFGVGAPALPLFDLGGPMRLASYGRTELLSNKYAMGRAGFLYTLPTSSDLLSMNTHLFAVYTAAREFDEPFATYPQNFTAGLLVETVVGPVLLGGSYGDRGHRKFLFQLGRIF